ncbi:hypothetical protein BU16DRAFT_582560 [Lophium mytilinum]|uniref:mRNA N(6)-methyladenine demethylase n=1 Tax=Lophium mytilinum TaxID=390894 RepID=A0A6A6QQP9_9PEZI|nr:hypothetical protein BU16DRAFT_582560 [Lophium mytilinum]
MPQTPSAPLNPHERPPEQVKNVYKTYQKMKPKELAVDPDIIDFTRGLSEIQRASINVIEEIDPKKLNEAFRDFEGIESSSGDEITTPIRVYEHSNMPGLHILPSLLPPSTQRLLLTRLLHRDLSNPTHLTNIHTHYTLAYPPPTAFSPTPSLFTHPPTSPLPIAVPLDPSIHRPFPAHPLLTRKLRWLTLGGQYDWTAKRYPLSPPPPFPPDIAALLDSVFPETRPEAAIVNLYTPGDTLSVHRDVAEGSERGLSSVSLGCEGVFVVGFSGEGEVGTGGTVLTFRLPSGSAVYMSGTARWAWHGVPQVVAGTCPGYLANWPAEERGKDGEDAEGGEYEAWRGWMANKRVNLNVRQMWD